MEIIFSIPKQHSPQKFLNLNTDAPLNKPKHKKINSNQTKPDLPIISFLYK
jgi:hypothetical protein